MTVTPVDDVPAPRKVGFLLGVGIFFLPFIFAWLVLRKGYGMVARLISFGWLLVWLALAFGGNHGAPATGGKAKPPVAQAGAAKSGAAKADDQAAAPAADAGDWVYNEDKDEMRGTDTRYAQVESDNRLDFDFPYQGGSRATLTVRRQPKDGLSVYLRISKGQFICHSFSGGHVSVKFDGAPVQSFRCSDTSDGSSDTIFIRNEGAFLAKLKKSSKVIIEAEFFQEGNRQMTFSTKGLTFK